MSIYLTKLASDNFHRANESPLNSAEWTLCTTNPDPDAAYPYGPLQVVSDLCEAVHTATGDNGGVEFYTGVSLPNDQYASFTINALYVAASLDGGLGAYVRQTPAAAQNGYDDGTGNQYELFITGGTTLGSADGHASLVWEGAGGDTFGIMAEITGLTVNLGDIWTLACIGTTFYILQNGTQVGSYSDATFALGQSGVEVNYHALATDTNISYFETGSASTTPPTYSISGNAGEPATVVSYTGTASGSVTADGSGNYTISSLANGSYTLTPSLAGHTFSPTSQNVTVSGANVTGVNFVNYVPDTSGLPFLGSVTVVAGIPAGENDVFQGTVKVVASAPPGENNPYLGHVNVLSAAPSGRWNPSLGQVVVLSSRPNNTAPDIWFGSVVES